MTRMRVTPSRLRKIVREMIEEEWSHSSAPEIVNAAKQVGLTVGRFDKANDELMLTDPRTGVGITINTTNVDELRDFRDKIVKLFSRLG